MDINQYIKQFIEPRDSLLRDLEAEYNQRKDIQPSIGMQAATFLRWLLQVINAKRALEFGTCLGYSTIYLAEALQKTGGKLIAIEQNADLVEATRENLERAGLQNVVELICGDASKVIKKLDGEFDFILQDSDKALYSEMLEDCIQKLRPLGILAADDTLFYPMGMPEKFSKPIDQYNKKLFADERLVSTILPIGEGLSISFKKAIDSKNEK